MPVKMTTIATALTVFAFLGMDGFAQDVSPVDPVPGTTGTAGHTLDELGRGIKAEARRVKQKIGAVEQEMKEEASHIKSGVAHELETVKSDVHKMPAQHRIYSRIHWDKSLHDAKVDVHMLPDGVVLLRGTVPNEAARIHAAELAKDSVDVTTVINELTLSSKVVSTKSAAAPKPTTRR
jgi:osmotically-inducible protein OsmY